MINLPQQRKKVIPVFFIQSRGRLIRKDIARGKPSQTGHGYPLEHSAGELAGKRVQNPFHIFQTLSFGKFKRSRKVCTICAPILM